MDIFSGGSIFFALGFVCLLLCVYLLSKRFETLRFFYSAQAGVFSVLGFMIASILLGLNVWKTDSTFFLTLFLFFTSVLGIRSLHEIDRALEFTGQKARMWAISMLHFGLFLFLLSLSFGNLSLERYYMMTQPHRAENRALDLRTQNIRRLPIALELQSFNISYFESDLNQPIPRRYLAHLRIYEYTHGEVRIFEDSIEVNHPLRVGGYDIYNASFDPDQEGVVTFLIVRDPWLYLTYMGIFLCLGGALGLLIASPHGMEMKHKKSLNL